MDHQTPHTPPETLSMRSVTQINTIEFFDLSIRNPKYINSVFLPTFSSQSLKRVKILRIIETHSAGFLKSRLEQVLLHHSKTVQKVSLPSYLNLPKKIFKKQLHLEEYKLIFPDHWKDLLGKLAINTLWIEAVPSLAQCQARKINILRAAKHIVKLKGLKKVYISMEDSLHIDSFGFFSALDKELARSQTDIEVHLEVSPSSSRSPRSLKANNKFLLTFPALIKRVTSLTTQSVDFFPKFITDNLLNLSMLKSLRIPIEVTENTSLEYLQLCPYLSGLLSLQMNFYFGNNAQGLQMFLHHFSTPTNLRALEIFFLSPQFQRSIDPNSNSGGLECDSLDLKVGFQSFLKRLQNLKELESLKLTSFLGSKITNLTVLYSLLVLLIREVNTLRTLHLLFESNQQVEFLLEKKSNSVEAPSVPFRLGRVINKYYTAFSRLDEVKLHLPAISFEEIGDGIVLPFRVVSISGRIIAYEGLRRFLKGLKPGNMQESRLTLKFTHVDMESISELFKAMTVRIPMELLEITIFSNKLERDFVLDSIAPFIRDLEGPKEVNLDIPELFMGYEEHYQVLEALEESRKDVRKLSILFGCNSKAQTSNFVFELDEIYRLTDFELFEGAKTYSEISSFGASDEEEEEEEELEENSLGEEDEDQEDY